MAVSSEGICSRERDYSQWYLDVIRAAELADYSPVKGSMVLRPHGFAIWEAMRDDLDARFKATGHVNAYFPLFIPLSFLSREAAHVEGFAKECAVVTHHRLRAVADPEGGVRVEPDPAARLEEPLVVRPTSETIIWHMYGRWIDSWRDLPILINQWANVVRWEMKTRPFLRTAEFLWQEGHTAHATEAEARQEALRMLEVYRAFAWETLAIPVVTGVKSATERFAGAVDTYTIEAMMQNGWALQAGTSHFLGQNFARAFDVTFQNEAGEREHVWATSWGVSTRLVGAVIMTHSDDTGLVLPPRLAPVQVAVVPIWRKDAQREEVQAFARRQADRLREAGLRVVLDERDNLKPGAKYYHWERRGVPLRLEIGPRDVAKRSAFAARRIGGDKFAIPEDTLVERVRAELDAIQAGLLERARAFRDARTVRATDRATIVEAIRDGCWVEAAWTDDPLSEAALKEATRATVRCYPLEGREAARGERCAWTGRPATHLALLARAY